VSKISEKSLAQTIKSLICTLLNFILSSLMKLSIFIKSHFVKVSKISEKSLSQSIKTFIFTLLMLILSILSILVELKIPIKTFFSFENLILSFLMELSICIKSLIFTV